MKKLVIILVVAAAAVAVLFYTGAFSRESAQAADQQAAQPGQPGGGGFGGGGRGGRGGFAGPMTVQVAAARRGTVEQQLTVVGNLIGDTTVAVVPRAAGRLEQVYVKLGDRVNLGQRIAKIEDQELQEQIRQAEAAQEVSRATIRQREADLKLAQTNVERSRSLFERQLLPKQTLDDNEARYQSAVAALDLARAQSTQSSARLEELRINMANTIVSSPVNGFVARRAADPGAFVSQNAPVVDVVDINRVRLVVNVVEKDLRLVSVGDTTEVEVDAFPGESFMGRVARVAPVLDPQTRTFPIEIEIPNPTFRLKPGMYARVGIIADRRENALVVPANAIVDVGGERGVFLAQQDNTATFQKVEIGIEEETQVEIRSGLNDGQRVVTTGAGALRDGDRFLLEGGRGGEGRTGGGRRGQSGAAPGGAAGSASLTPSGGAAAEGREAFAGREGFGAAEGARRGGRRAGGAPGQAPVTP
jgi:RND family efflux transporter MFP subunit